MDSKGTLSFFEAMRDFRTMFPSMDVNLIESVLRANNGAVEDTIDQLLAMSLDEENTIDEPTLEGESSQATLPSRSADNSLEDFLSRSLPQTNAATTRKSYNPPLVGKLPNDFLRIGNDLQPSRINLMQNKNNLENHQAFNSDFKLPPPDYATATRSLTSVPSNIFNASRGRTWSDYATLYNSKTYETRTSRDTLGYKAVDDHFDTLAPCSSIQQARHDEAVNMALRRQSEVFKDRMTENEWKRQITRDPGLEQYLEDERIALMLQNEEFLAHLKNDPDFIAALEQDNHEKRSRKRSRKSNSRKLSMDSYPRHSAASNHSDPVDEADPFPYTKILPKPDTIDVPFSDKLKCMGKNSKRKFAILARKFIHKKRGARALIGTNASHYPEVALLQDSSRFGEGELLVEKDASPDCVTGYNQISDESYNIGHNTELKEGRLFSVYRS